MKLWLHTSQPVDDLREILIDRFPFVIGRRSDSDCALPLAFISRHHCQFILNDDQVLVQDLESYNGTFVNGQKASHPLPVRHGDELSLGPVSFRVVIELATPETDDEVYLGPTREETQLFEAHGVPDAPGGSGS
jgi:pSer/pThr/pTyr-binding forkhead associated (FHA) protein